ncbi:hypothetical protein FGO68_gene12738 [Halteria grandinella]|uniref:Uncharacterized protein n=1 Tax=Halteria grandinella TaxID=5974 RepID=A0A8J8SZM5_HALGN|nr:hypothetical protein FGO68_gene12738 [Halteria grandinella]
MDIILFRGDTFATDLTFLRESALLLISLTNSELDQLLPNKKLRMMLLDELIKAHQVVLESERRGLCGPFENEAESYKSDDKATDELQNTPIGSTDILKAINAQQRLNVLMQIANGQQEQIYQIAKSHSHLFDQDQLKFILQLTRVRIATKPYLLIKLRHTPQLLAMVLAYTKLKYYIDKYLWNLSKQSRHFLKRYSQNSLSSLQKYLSHSLIDWSTMQDPYVLQKLKKFPHLQISILGYIQYGNIVCHHLWRVSRKSRAFYKQHVDKRVNSLFPQRRFKYRIRRR